jgi:hypothetical protein
MTQVFWINRMGEERRHSLMKCTLSYARNWWRENILECQGILSIDERRNTKLKFLRVENALSEA